MNREEIDEIIAGLEDFYQVVITAPRGDVIEVQNKLANYFIMSRQSVKQMFSALPYPIPQGSRSNAEILLNDLEECGVICELDHYGPRWLDSYSNLEIEEKLRSINDGCLEGICIKKNSDPNCRAYEIYSGCDRLDFCYEDDESDEEYGLHLACIRYLAKRNLIDRSC